MKKFTFTATILLWCLNSLSQIVGIQPFATGLSNVVEITHPANDSRLFAVQKTGQIRIVNTDGSVNSTAFLTVTGLSSGGEQGLLGLAFHPNYTSNGLFYVNYTNTAGDTVIARYSVSGNPDIANTTETILMTIDQPYTNHNGGSIKFGPDGYLYIGMGDGGSGGDPDGYAQNLTVQAGNRVFLGKMLRLDVDSASPYGIPSTNPYVGQAGREEIWAIGLRNPWKFSFNRLTGDLWIADVGQNNIEEINRTTTPIPTGLNFGWRCYEGNSAYNTSGCAAMATMTFPLAQYTHTGGACSVTGGYVYTGTTFPNLQNKYFFADYCLNRIGYVNSSGTITYSTTFGGANNFTSFGENKNGELYVTNGSTIYRVIDTSLSTDEFTKNDFTVYPNPSKSVVKIESNGNSLISQIDLCDVNGKFLVSEKNIQMSSFNLDTQNLNSGIYILKIKDQTDRIQNHKLVIQ